MRALPAATSTPSLGRTAAGVFLLVFAAYALTSPGRFDSIDTQWRYEVAANLLDHGSPSVRDPALLRLLQYSHGVDGRAYSLYEVGGSLTALPAMLLGRALAGAGSELERFLYVQTNSAFGALCAVLLLRFYVDLGLPRRRALAWTLVSAFASMLWPLSCTSLENVQHAFFVLASLWLAHRSAVRGSTGLAAAAGLTAGALFDFKIAFGALMPTLALATLAGAASGDDRRPAARRYVAFGAASAVGLLGWMAFNAVRFGGPFSFGDYSVAASAHPPVLGNPLVGASSLLVSPGRSVLLYSPPLLLGLLGIRGLWRRHPSLARAIVATSAVQFALISSLTFFAGDWCWGPRYLGCLLPLWALAAPFASEAVERSWLTRAVVAVGVCVQLLGLSVDHTVFFMHHQLPAYFWYQNRWFYFHHSALLERPAEALAMHWRGRPPRARLFGPSIHPGSPTSALLGAAAPAQLPAALPTFVVFQVPRPWPFWALRVTRPLRPVPVWPTVLGLAALGALGAALLRARDGSDDPR